jgi:tetratricopeptide (TPR) repeat protein
MGYHVFVAAPGVKARMLKAGGAQALLGRQKEWNSRVAVACRKQRPGDILVLAEEAPTQGLRLKAYRSAAKALRRLEQFDFALEQIERALEVAPGDLVSRQEKGMLLGRLNRFDDAREWLRALARDHPRDARTRGLLGRVERDEWVRNWRRAGAAASERREAALGSAALLKEAAHACTSGFLEDPASYPCGIDAVTLLHLSRHLAGVEDDHDATLRTEMEGGVQWAAKSALSKETANAKNFRARVAIAALKTLTCDPASVAHAYRYALAAADQDGFSLNATRRQLSVLEELGFRPEAVAEASRAVDFALQQGVPPYRARRVFLFSGHMIDAPGRDSERFPPDMEDLAKAAIERALDAFGAAEGDLALCEGACGGDLLFARAALDRKLRLELRLPFDEPTFLRESVTFAGPEWEARYFDVRRHAANVLLMPDELGPAPANGDPYERTNLWQLYCALAWGPQNVRMIALWNREKSGKRGGTDHMTEAVTKRAGQIEIVDARELLAQTRAHR